MRLDRQYLNATRTIGSLWEIGAWGSQTFLCFTMEDRVRPKGVKVDGETCIPFGTYLIVPRAHGGFYERYKDKYPSHHHGMLELMDVPGFTDILIHPGNDAGDTKGCILPGTSANPKANVVTDSVGAYIPLYNRVIGAAVDGDLSIEIRKSADVSKQHLKQWQKHEDAA